MKKASIVVGLGFGDEGKGLATDFLCLQNRGNLVIRFNGGHQAGHTVITSDGISHTFSNFGAGTLRDVPTYWSRYCTFSPSHFIEELGVIKKKPRIFINHDCPVTTHYDVLYNRATETSRGTSRNGSCGLGFGATIQRHFYSDVKLSAADLLFPETYVSRLRQIRNYYETKFEIDTGFSFSDFDHDREDELFEDTCISIHDLVKLGVVAFASDSEVFSGRHAWENYVFEGAQGILLDVTYGQAPYVTKSNTTSQNAIQLIQSHLKDLRLDIELFYVSRVYQTRHGAGPFRQPDVPLRLINNQNETNVFNEFQGEFRIGNLDVDRLNYSIKCDSRFSKGINKSLIITCVDQIGDDRIPLHRNNVEEKVSYAKIPSFLECKFNNVLFSSNPCAEFLKF